MEEGSEVVFDDLSAMRAYPEVKLYELNETNCLCVDSFYEFFQEGLLIIGQVFVLLFLMVLMGDIDNF